MNGREDGWTEIGTTSDGAQVLFAPVGTPAPGTVMTRCPRCLVVMARAERAEHECAP